MMKRIALTLISALLAMVSTVRAAETAPQVSLLTFYPGGEVYELVGHTALRIVHPHQGTDVTINWGTFDFNSPGFLYRFVKGETDYMVAAAPTDYYVGMYCSVGRRVVEQVLDLTPTQARAIDSLVAVNMRPENRVYRYNYVLDNCATRPLAVIEKALGSPLALDTAGVTRRTTFRQVMTDYHRNYPWYQFGIDLALGSGIDRPISIHEKSFAPVELMHLVDGSITAQRPLVSATRVLCEGSDDAVAGPTPWLLTPMAAALALLLAGIVVSVRDIRCRRLTRWFDSAVFSLYGLAGLLLSFLVFISVHEATSPNWLILWLNPLCFIAGVGVWIKSAKKAVFCYQIVNFALVLTLSCIVLAGIQRVNAAVWPLMLVSMMRAATYIYLSQCQLTVKNPA